VIVLNKVCHINLRRFLGLLCGDLFRETLFWRLIFLSIPFSYFHPFQPHCKKPYALS